MHTSDINHIDCFGYGTYTFEKTLDMHQAAYSTWIKTPEDYLHQISTCRFYQQVVNMNTYNYYVRLIKFVGITHVFDAASKSSVSMLIVQELTPQSADLLKAIMFLV